MDYLQLEPLSEKNCREVYESSEREIQFWSAPLDSYKPFMQIDLKFNPEMLK